MLKQTFATKLAKICYVKSISYMSTQGNVYSILSTHLNIDSNGIRKIRKLKADSIIVKIPSNQIVRNCAIMQSMDVNLEMVEFLADCLQLQPSVIRNRISILKEMGVKSVGLQDIFRFPSSMRKSINTFKRTYNIPKETNVMKIIFSNIGISGNMAENCLANFNFNSSVGDYYKIGMSYYKTFHLQLHDELFYKSTKVKYRSFKELSYLVHILKTKCHFDSKFINRHPSLLYLDVDNVETFLNEFKYVQINGKNILYILRKHPRILCYDANRVKQFLHLYRVLDIPEDSLLSYTMVLGMTKTKFLERYMDYSNVCELALWLQYPRVFRMIYYYKTVKHRVDYLKPLNCISSANINTFLAQKNFFLRFIEGDTSHSACKKYLSYIVRKELGEDNIYVVRSIQKHPYWRNIPLIHVNNMLRYLKKYYSIEDICQNIHIVLYPRSKVIDVLDSLRKEYSEQEEYNFTDKQYLALCLYKLEKKYHFSGDAVWQTVQSEMSDLSSNFFEDIEANKSDNLVEFINDDNNEMPNVSGAAWLEYLLRSY